MNTESTSFRSIDTALEIERIEAYALACRVDGGPVSTLALMPVRCGLVIKITSTDGAYGWGEAWCNYPPKGNISKLSLLRDPIAPALFEAEVSSWQDLRPALEKKLCRMMIHTGEWGPFAHCLAALDIAAADLSARRAGMGMAAFLGAPEARDAKVYASSPGTENAEDLAPKLTEDGHTGVKIKIGFDRSGDADVLARFRTNDNAKMQLFVDANQKWSVGEAATAIAGLESFDVSFVEEPILALAPLSDWKKLARTTAPPLAAGENITSAAAFKRHVDQQSLGVIQPDVAKWGGISGALDVGRYALSRGAGCTLHYMGTAVGLAASLHTLGAIGGEGRVELDANRNPLRTELGSIDLKTVDGKVRIPSGEGIGFEPDQEAMRRFSVAFEDIRK
jgi:L-alanine-DL-glutamate epimerase-like enolase superfamily enzyme